MAGDGSNCSCCSSQPTQITYIPYGEEGEYDDADNVQQFDFFYEDESSHEELNRPGDLSGNVKFGGMPSPPSRDIGNDNVPNLSLSSCRTLSTGLLVAFGCLGLFINLLGYMDGIFAKRRRHRHCWLHIYLASIGCIGHVPFLKVATIIPQRDELLIRLLYFMSNSAQVSCMYQLLHLLAVRSRESFTLLKYNNRLLKVNCFMIFFASMAFGIVGALLPRGSPGNPLRSEGHYVTVSFVITFLLPIMIAIYIIASSRHRRVRQMKDSHDSESKPTRSSSTKNNTMQRESLGRSPLSRKEVKLPNSITDSSDIDQEAAVLFVAYVICWAPLKVLQLHRQREQEFHKCGMVTDFGLTFGCTFSFIMPLLRLLMLSRRRRKRRTCPNTASPIAEERAMVLVTTNGKRTNHIWSGY